MEDHVSANDAILTNLLPNLKQHKSWQLLDSRRLSGNDWLLTGISFREDRVLNLSHGVHKVGIPDLIMLQQVIQEGFTLYTFDKHFYLMQNFLSFKLL